MLLSACGSAPEFPEELSPAPVYAARPDIQYFDLVFPDRRQQFLSLQLAMVRSKSQAASIERTMLKHHIPYRWLRVATKDGARWLLLTEAYLNDQKLIRQRSYLQRLLPAISEMPVLAAAGYDELNQPVVAQQSDIDNKEKVSPVFAEDNL